MTPLGSSVVALLAVLALVGHQVAGIKQAQPKMMSSLPKFTYDSTTTPYCTYWHDDDGTPWSCQDVYDYLWVEPADFLRWVGSPQTELTGLQQAC